ncbi:MAG: hypothetical protein ABJA10_03325, partial [Aestuariivirga sp.]
MPAELAAVAAKRERRFKDLAKVTRKGIRIYWKARNKARRKSTERSIIDGRGAARSEKWGSGRWGTGERRFRSVSAILAAHEALRVAFEVKGTLDTRDVTAACGERYWRQDMRWAIEKGLCTVNHVPSTAHYDYGHGFRRTFTRTRKPWCIWQPMARKVKAYEAMEREAHEY